MNLRRMYFAILFVVLWIVAYLSLEPIVGLLVSVIPLEPGLRVTEAIRFFLYEAPKVVLLLTIVVFGVGIIRSYFSPERSGGCSETEASWNLIPATPGHPNPVGPVSIDGNSSVETDYVEWTPTVAPAHQCLLAIAYINDNPQDSNNPDPIVYPFEIPWENNIGQRNVHVMELENGSNGEFSIQTWNPFHKGKEVLGSIAVVLTYSSKLPIFGFPRKLSPLKVSLVLDGTREISLKPLGEDQRIDRRVILDNRCHRERAIAGATISKVSFSSKKAHRLDVKVSVSKDAVRGSVYYLHIAQSISGMLTGGYTAVVIIV